jgi:hypothetical protein
MEPVAQQYLMAERRRQIKLKQQLGKPGSKQISEDELRFHFDLLQFCDHISLYVCFNYPGYGQNKTINWDRQGFKQRFECFNGQKIEPIWINPSCIQLTPFPLVKSNKLYQVRLKRVFKASIKTKGLIQAFQESPWELQKITFTA